MHISVLLNETLEALRVQPGGSYIDGTLGCAGHSAVILEQAGSEGRLLGIDRDTAALARAGERLKCVAGQKVLVHGEHGRIRDLAETNGFTGIDGILLDLGVSSDQLDTPERGFSFRADGPLDMRMKREAGETAADLIARLSVPEMARLFRELGEEPQAQRIARAIDRERQKAPIRTTLALADTVSRALGGAGGKRHPATRIFQALRMAVNGEMEDLKAALEDGLALLAPGGRFAVITFESLTDRVVKQFFKAHAGRYVSLQQGGERWEGELPAVKLIWKHAVTASPEELAHNPRARSAKLRAAERLPDGIPVRQTI